MIEISKEISTNLRKKGYKVQSELRCNPWEGRTTYKGLNLKTKNPVIIKYFRLLGAKSWSGLNAIEREIRTLSSLNHPRIPKYMESWENNGNLFIVTEYINAPNASIQSFTEQEVQKIAIALLEILEYLHSQNPPLIHRDIKPENILVDDDLNVFLVDFGLAKASWGETTTASTTVAGTLGFISPELMRNKPCRASDLYALGITLICLLYQINSSEVGNYINEDFSVNFKQLPRKSVPKRLVNLIKKLTEPKLNKRILYPSVEPLRLTRARIVLDSGTSHPVSHS
ncbi:MAG: serine/threonine protein kinase [Hydrococcus sp. RM1_1_31]|nr:serine/threonine protein kinase [Hydrococcus sp. RM1_1_31]